MRKFLFFLGSLILSHISFSQMPGGAGGRQGGGGQQMNIGRFYGKIVDSKTNKGMEAVSVQLIQSKFDTVSKKRRDSVIAGMFTPKSGNFSFESLPLFGNFRLTITAIGYKPIEQKVAFEMKPGQGDMSQAMAGIDKDLGNIKVEADAQVLQSVTVTGTKPLMQMGIDRKIFNVEKNITSAGGTGVDVMRNIPAVNVDIDGNVTLRNSAPQIFVDGRPTTLTLEQIPADAIQSVEIITNPSAKFDASGGQSGILNIVLKKNKRVGYSGNLRANVDSRGRVGGGGDVNLRQNKINFFASGMYNQRKSISNGSTERENLIYKPSTSEQIDKTTMVGAFGFGRLGFDYFIDNRNTLTISGTVARGKMNPNGNSTIFNDLNNDAITDTLQERSNYATNLFRNMGSQLSFKHNFPKSGREWTADVTYNKGRNNNDT